MMNFALMAVLTVGLSLAVTSCKDDDKDNGGGEPTAEELQKLREHPFVKQVNDLFATDVIFARVKKNQ